MKMSGKKVKPNQRRSQGKGSIYQLGSTGKWRGQYTVEEHGRRKRKTITGNSYKEVEEKLDKILNDIREKKYIGRNKITIGEILEENLQNKEHSNKICKSTMLRNRETAKVILKSDIANMPIQQVQRQDIQDFLNKVAEKYSNSYIDKIHIHLSNVFKTAMLDHYINEDFFAMKAIDKPTSVRPDKKVDALTIEEHKAFRRQLEKKDYKYKDIFYVLIETGMRVRRSISIKKRKYRFQGKCNSCKNNTNKRREGQTNRK